MKPLRLTFVMFLFLSSASAQNKAPVEVSKRDSLIQLSTSDNGATIRDILKTICKHYHYGSVIMGPAQKGTTKKMTHYANMIDLKMDLEGFRKRVHAVYHNINITYKIEGKTVYSSFYYLNPKR